MNSSSHGGQERTSDVDLLANGTCDAARWADQALGRLRNRLPELILALEGRTDAHFGCRRHGCSASWTD